jgi:hypothetical protein
MPQYDNRDDDQSYQSDIQENYNNAYSHSRKNSLKLLKLFLDKFKSLSPNNDQAESQPETGSMQNTSQN